MDPNFFGEDLKPNKEKEILIEIVEICAEIMLFIQISDVA